MRLSFFRVKRTDILLVAAALLASLILFLLLPRTAGGTVVISYPGFMQRYPLDRDEIISIDRDGHRNEVRIEKGTAYMSVANCPDQRCIAQGAIGLTGESIVCLPGRVSIMIEGGAASGVDAVAQ